METAGCIPNAWKSMFLPVELKGDHEKRRQPMPVAPLSIADRLMASDHAVSASQPVSLRADAKAGPRVCTVFAAASTARELGRIDPPTRLSNAETLSDPRRNVDPRRRGRPRVDRAPNRRAEADDARGGMRVFKLESVTTRA